MRDQFSEVNRFFSAATGDGQGTAMRCKDWRHLQLVMANSSVSGTDTYTLKVKGGVKKDGTEPTWASAASESNPWYYLQIVDKENGAEYDGNVGYVCTATEVKAFEVNTFGEDWVNVEISSSTGTFTVTVDGRCFGL